MDLLSRFITNHFPKKKKNVMNDDLSKIALNLFKKIKSN